MKFVADLIKTFILNVDLTFPLSFSDTPVEGHGQVYNIGSITADQEKIIETVNTAWKEENPFPTNMEGNVTGSNEILRDKATVVDGPNVVHKSLEPKNNRSLSSLFALSFSLYPCFVFDESCYTYLQISK